MSFFPIRSRGRGRDGSKNGSSVSTIRWVNEWDAPVSLDVFDLCLEAEGEGAEYSSGFHFQIVGLS